MFGKPGWRWRENAATYEDLSSVKSLEAETAGSDVRQMIDLLADRFEAAWSQEGEPDLANFLQQANGTARRSLAIELVHLDLEWSQRRGKARTLEYYASRLPELLGPGGALPQEIVDHFWSLQNEPHRQLIDRDPAMDASQAPKAHLSDPYRTASPAPEPAGSAPSGTGSFPATIGRYRVERILGKGGFGC